jgi:hypothetical protein
MYNVIGKVNWSFFQSGNNVLFSTTKGVIHLSPHWLLQLSPLAYVKFITICTKTQTQTGNMVLELNGIIQLRRGGGDGCQEAGGITETDRKRKVEKPLSNKCHLKTPSFCVAHDHLLLWQLANVYRPRFFHTSPYNNTSQDAVHMRTNTNMGHRLWAQLVPCLILGSTIKYLHNPK